MSQMDYSTLARLIHPVAPADFFAEHWERRPLRLARADRGYFADLLSLDEIDRVVTTLSLHHPEISIVNAARRVAPEDYAYPSGLIDAVRLAQCFADGGTIVLQQLEARVPALAALCRAMEHELSTRFQTNVYVSPGGNAQGFRAHYDSHDVFVLQVHGRKRWVLYDAPVALPYRRQEFHPAHVAPGAVSSEFDLEAGDLLYVPRGTMHDARTEDSTSVHITLGVLFTSWTDLLAEALASVGLDDPAFRQSLPPGFARPEFDRTRARETFRTLLARLSERADLDAALDRFAGNLVATRHPLVRGQLAQLARLATLTLATRVGARPDVLYQLRDDAQGVTLSCYGGTLTLPVHAAAAVRFALGRAEFRVGELPGDLDDEGKLVLARRLVREGLVRLL